MLADAGGARLGPRSSRASHPSWSDRAGPEQVRANIEALGIVLEDEHMARLEGR